MRTIDALQPGKAARVPAPTLGRATRPLPLGWLVGAAALSCILVRAMLVAEGLSLAIAAWPLDIACAVVAAIGLALYSCHGAARGWRCAAFEGLLHASLFSVYCLAGAIAAYPIAAAGGPYVDGTLARADALFGFHWFAWYDFVAAHRWAQIAGRICYESIFVTPALLIGWFAVSGRTAEARRFLLCFWTAAVATLSIARFLPVQGPLARHMGAALPYMPSSGLWQAELPPALRLHELPRVDLMALHGLVGAPSFHTASAVVYVAAGWRCRRLRWPVLAIDLAMLLATPVEGTHYLVDMLMGAGVALASVALVDAIIRRRARVPAPPRSAAPAPNMP